MELKLTGDHCRICLKMEGFISVFDRLNDCVIADIFMQTFGIKIEKHPQNDEIPSKICGNCLTSIQTARKLLTMCKESDRLVKKLESANNSSEAPENTQFTFIKVESEIKEEQHSNFYEDFQDCSSVQSEEISKKKKTKTKIRKVARKRSKIAENPMTCDKCGMNFDNKNKLKHHINEIHLQEAPYWKTYKEKILPCDTCGKLFSRMHDLEVHRRVHTGEKPYHCKFCLKQFAFKHSFHRHSQLHTKNFKYKCSICESGFTDLYLLKKHEEKHKNGTFLDNKKRRVRIKIFQGTDQFRLS